MKASLVLPTLALALIPAVAGAQPMAPNAGPPALSQQQQAQLSQLRAQVKQNHVELRSRIIASLTPAQRTQFANIVGQLALTPNPDPRAAVQAVDNILTPAEKQSVLALASSERSSTKSIEQQERSVFESAMTPDQKAAMAQRKAAWQAKRAAFEQSHPRPAHVADAGAVVLKTLAFAGGMHHHHRMM